MSPLFLRMLSHGLQGLLPAAAAAAWFAADGRVKHVRAIAIGAVLALVATWPGAWLFARSTNQAHWELALAALATLAVAWCAKREAVVSARVVGAVAALLVIRQTIIPGAVLSAALNARSTDATVQTVTSAVAALVMAAAWLGLTRSMPRRGIRAASAVYFAMFLAQTALYALHRAAELRLLPWAEPFDTLSEPWGPEGVYGMWLSVLTAAAPAACGILVSWIDGVRRPLIIGTATVVLMAGGIAAARAPRGPAGEIPMPHGASAGLAAADYAAVTAAPHLLFRSSLTDETYGRLAIGPLATSEHRRVTAPLQCERVAFAEGVGICLQADRGLRTKFTGILFDSAFRPTKMIPLAGEPSRARVSPDGRIGAWTTFVTGLPHSYAATGFSTATILIDMTTGDVIGNLEDFTTWRDGRRFKEVDFNFWGVTFTRDVNVFYATLSTGGATMLVRGDLGLRKLTVIREGVECPSISPDNTLIVYKHRLGPIGSPWRLHVLDLATLADRPLPGEARSIDDQVEWLDAGHVLYGIERQNEAVRDVWIASVSGAEPPRVFLAGADSPVVAAARLAEPVSR